MEDRNFLRCGRSLHQASQGAPNLRAALLGRSTRYTPDRSVDTLHVLLELSIDFSRKRVSGTCTTTVRSFRDAVSLLEFDASGLDIRSVTLDGKTQRFKHADEKLKIYLSKPLASDGIAKIAVVYRVDHPKAGLHFVSPGPHNGTRYPQLWSQSQPEDARYWYPCHDNPHEKATSELIAEVPAGFRVISNGALVSSSTRDGRSIFHWKMSQPHSLYLISLAAGRFSEIAETWDGIPVTYYCEKGRESDARRGFAKTPKAMDYFSKMTGMRYPYEKYAQVAVAEYPGGMEHTTCTTQTDAILIDKRAALDTDLDFLVAHELAHQWFGDLLTCRDWSHAWLNEGFATYLEILFCAHDKGQDEADSELASNATYYFDEDSRRYRRPIVCEIYKFPWVLFDRHTYEKGAWVLHMLRYELGEELFWKSVRHYVRKHAHQSVVTSDLSAAIEEATGLNIKPFFDQWVYRGGYPSLKVQYQWDPKARSASLWIVQTQDVSDDNPAYKIPAVLRFYGKGWTREFAEKLDAKEHHFTFKLPSEPLNIELDPDHRLLKKLQFLKTQSMWRHQLLHGERARSRAEAASPVARWGDQASVEILLKAISREKHWSASCDMIRALGSIRSEAAFSALWSLRGVVHPKIRRALVESLGSFDRPDAAAWLSRLARRDPSVHVAAQALRSLGGRRDPRFKNILTTGLSSSSYRDAISAGAISGLSASRDPSALAHLRRACRPPYGFGSRSSALRALGEFSPYSPEVVPLLCEFLTDPDERINLTAISVLGQLEDHRALPALKLARKSPSGRVKAMAEETIARISAGTDEKKDPKTSTRSGSGNSRPARPSAGKQNPPKAAGSARRRRK